LPREEWRRSRQGKSLRRRCCRVVGAGAGRSDAAGGMGSRRRGCQGTVVMPGIGACDMADARRLHRRTRQRFVTRALCASSPSPGSGCSARAPCPAASAVRRMAASSFLDAAWIKTGREDGGGYVCFGRARPCAPPPCIAHGVVAAGRPGRRGDHPNPHARVIAGFVALAAERAPSPARTTLRACTTAGLSLPRAFGRVAVVRLLRPRCWRQ
jgi:hypothetical protein